MKFTNKVIFTIILFAFVSVNYFACAQDFLQLGIDKIQKHEYKSAIEDLKKAIEKTPKSSKAHFYLGEAYYLTKQYDQAEVSLKKAVDLDDEFAQAFKRLGDVYSIKKLYREALDQYARAVKLDKKNSSYQLALGLAYLDVDSVDKAIATISQAHINNPKDPAPLVALGDAYLKLNVPVMAVDNYKKAIELDSNYAEAHKKLGDVYYTKMKMYKDALNEYIVYANLDSTNADNLEKVGHLLFYNKIYNTAIVFYEKLVKIDKENYNTYTELGASYMYSKDFENAIKNLEIAVTLNPKPVEAMRYLANSYYYDKNFESAFAKFGELEKIDSLKADEYAKFARAALGKKDTSSAIDLFKKAIDVDPELDVYSELASIFQKQRRNKEAAEFYFKKAEIDTTVNKIRYYIAAGQFYNAEKEYDKAVECFKIASELDKNDPKNYFFIAQIYKQYPKNDSMKLAIDYYTKFLSLAEKNQNTYKEEIKYTYFDLGEYEYKVTKNFPKSLSYFDDLLRFDPRNRGALMYRAICLMSMNKKEDACKAFDKVLQYYPNNKDAEDLKKKNQCWIYEK